MYFKDGQNIKKKIFQKPKTLDIAVVVFSFSQNKKTSQIFMSNNPFLHKREQVITYWENNYWHCQGDSHQHSQTDNEKQNISLHDRRVGMKQFWLNVFYRERQKKKKCLMCAVLSGD